VGADALARDPAGGVRGAYEIDRTTAAEVKLSPVVGRYFEVWICHDSWDSHHALDNERFYRFVKAVARYSRPAPSSGDIHALIVSRRGRRARRIAYRFVELYETLLAYEKTRGFPDALIERTDIVKYHLELSVRGGGNARRIARVMSDAWGNDWQTKLDAASGLTRP